MPISQETYAAALAASRPVCDDSSDEDYEWPGTALGAPTSDDMPLVPPFWHPHCLDLFLGPDPLLTKAAGTAKGVEVRSDIYFHFFNDAIGAKLRDVDPITGEGGRLEVKLRSDLKKRGAERWEKKRFPSESSNDFDGASAAIKSITGLDQEVFHQVWLKKRRSQEIVRGMVVEQTDLEVAVRIKGGEWQPLEQKYRTLCFEGQPGTVYAGLGQRLGIGKEWEPFNLDGFFAPLRARCPPTVVPHMLGGYPKFVEELLAALESNTSP